VVRGTLAGRAHVAFDLDDPGAEGVDLTVDLDPRTCEVLAAAPAADPRSLAAATEHVFPDGHRAVVGPGVGDWVDITQLPAHARGAFVGDLLSRVLEAGGQRVTREYYFNDSGTQVRNLGASVLAIREGQAIPEDGYHGDYVAELAPELPDDLATPRADPARTRSDAPGGEGDEDTLDTAVALMLSDAENTDAPVVQVINLMVIEAMRRRASRIPRAARRWPARTRSRSQFPAPTGGRSSPTSRWVASRTAT
jgi:hypothetical protein